MKTFAPALVLVLSTSVAQAEPILYTDRSAFEAALDDFALFDFSDSSQHPCAMSFDPSSFVCEGSYNGLNWRGDRSNSTTSGGQFSFRVLADSTFSVVEPLRGIGFDFVGGGGSLASDVRFSYGLGGDPLTSLILAPGTFFGIIFDGEPLRMFFAPPLGGSIYQSVTIDNLTVARVPEPSTLLLVTASVAVLSVARGRSAANRRARQRRI